MNESPIVIGYRVELVVERRVVDQVQFSGLDVAQAMPKDVPGDRTNLWNQSICDTAQERLAIDHEIVDQCTDTWLLRIFARKSDASEVRAFRAMLTEGGQWEIWNLHA